MTDDAALAPSPAAEIAVAVHQRYWPTLNARQRLLATDRPELFARGGGSVTPTAEVGGVGAAPGGPRAPESLATDMTEQ